MRIVIAIIFSLLMPLMMVSNNLQETFSKANELYDKAKYSEAIEMYNTILGQGYVSSELYLNIGNAYYRQNNYTYAILNYEKAKKLNSTDENIIHNISVANTKIVDKIERIQDVFFIQWWNALKRFLSSDIWAIISIVFFVFGAVLFGLFMLSADSSKKKLGFYGSIILVTISVFTFVFARDQHNFSTGENECIVIAPSLQVKSEPNDLSVNKVVVHEGLKLIILNKDNNWYNVELPNGDNGFVRVDEVEVI